MSYQRRDTNLDFPIMRNGQVVGDGKIGGVWAVGARSAVLGHKIGSQMNGHVSRRNWDSSQTDQVVTDYGKFSERGWLVTVQERLRGTRYDLYFFEPLDLVIFLLPVRDGSRRREIRNVV
jgi:hypothetical protein